MPSVISTVIRSSIEGIIAEHEARMIQAAILSANGLRPWSFIKQDTFSLDEVSFAAMSHGTQ